jgi:Glycosyl transferases group 1
MGEVEPFVVLCWESDAGYVPPFKISPRQFTIGMQYTEPMNVAVCADPPDIVVPAGDAYDLDATMRRAGIEERPDLIVVWSSALRANIPVNLGAFRCPKLLICGDTHHMRRPIRSMIDYARAEAFDAVASVYDRHHLHWFLAAGFTECAWLPGISVQDTAPPWQTERTDQVAFVGQMGAMHGWRQALLEHVAAAGIPLRAALATRAQAAVLYAQSFASFNGSLNGDLNMRVFEVLSAGGFLLTDRLSPQAGLELLLRPGQDCETYGDAGELLDKLTFYRRSPGAALRIAEQGAATYRREHLAEHRIAVLLDWMLGGRLQDRFNPRHDLRYATSLAAAGQLGLRIAIYEMLQEQQRERPGLSVLVPREWPVASVLDVADLVRTRVSVVEPAPALRTAVAAASVFRQVRFVEADAAIKQDWDIVLTTSFEGANERWRGRAGRVVFADFGHAAGGP